VWKIDVVAIVEIYGAGKKVVADADVFEIVRVYVFDPLIA
jgi:hypothetical protein